MRPLDYAAYASVLLTCLLTVAYFGVAEIWRSQASKEQARRTLRVASAGVNTVDMLMRETALAMEALDKKITDSEDQRIARAASGSAIADFGNLLSSASCASCIYDEERIAKVLPDLVAMREQIDHYLHSPGNNIPERQINSIIRGMARLTSATQAIVANQINAAWKAQVGAGEELALLTFTNDLHERSEQLRSGFLPAVAARRQLSAAEQLQIERILARIEELQDLIGMTALRRADLQPLAEGSFESRSYLDGLQFTRSLLAILAQSTPAELDVATLNRQYAPFVSAITKFRDDLLAEYSRRIKEQQTVLEIQLTLGALAALAILLTLVWALAELWSSAVHPFELASRIIRSFIQEAPAAPPSPLRTYRGATREFFETLTSLKEHIDFKRNLESRQGELIGALQKMAETDHLTGLLNRRAFERRVAETISEWNDPGKLLVFMLFDIDNFKAVNDSHGHMAGDAALAVIAEICRETCRKEDIVARVGGEEFAVVGFADSASEADEIAHRLRLDIQKRAILSAPSSFFHITASFGVAVSRHHEICNTSVLFGKADQLLYMAKSCGRNCVMSDDKQHAI